MRVIIDVQGFKIENNKFIVKEFAAYDGKNICHYIFKPPFPMRMLPSNLYKQAIWLTENHHGLNWKDGFVPLHQFPAILQYVTSKSDGIYAKGKEKVEYLQKYSSKPVFELDEQPALEQQEPRCFFHTSDLCICALSNVYYLYDIFLMKE